MAIYATYELAKTDIQLLDTDESNRGIIERLLESASAAIDRFCNRPLGFQADAEATVKIYPGTGRAYQLIDECVEITLVAVKDSVTETAYTAWTVADWIAATGDYNHPDFNSLPYMMLITLPNGDYSRFTNGRLGDRYQTPTVQVTARWGYAETAPAQIATATIMQTARWFKRLQSAMGDTLASAQLGQLIFVQELDPDIGMILKRGRFVHVATGRW